MLKFCLVILLSVSCLAGPVEHDSQQQQQPQQQQQQVPVSAATQQAPVAIPQSEQVTEDPRAGRSYNRHAALVEESLLQKLNSKCAKRDPSSCAALKIVASINRLLKKENIGVADNIEITRTSFASEATEDLPRSISQQSEESQMAALISSKILSFVRSRALRLRLLPDLEAVITSSPDAEGNLNLGMSMQKVAQEGRGKQKHMGGLLAAMVMKFGMLAALAFKGLVLLVGKALLVSKIALLLAVILGLKKLFSTHQKHVTYEVVAQPHHAHAHIEHIDHGHSGSGGGGGGGGHDSYSSGWGRSSDHLRGDAHRMAYRGYVPKI